MTHEHDMQPVGPKPGHQIPDGALSLNATFAEAILASKACFDAAASVIKEAEPDSAEGLHIVTTLNIHLGTGYAMLAQALQHGAPGQRF